MMLGMLAATASPGTAYADLQRTFDRLLDETTALTGLSRASLAPDPQSFAASSTRDRQLPLFRDLMAHPLEIPGRVARVEAGFREALASPAQLMARTIELAGGASTNAALARAHSAQVDGRLLCASDPLAIGMALMLAQRPVAPGVFGAPVDVRGTWPLRVQIGRVLAAIGQADRLRTQALVRMPVDATPSLLLHQVLGAQEAPDVAGGPDYRRLLSMVDRQTLFAGMLHLAEAVEALDQYLANASGDLPAIAWQWDTPIGQVVIDTTGRDTERRIQDPLLVVDVGGNDTYLFPARTATNRIAVLLDRGGNDRYVALAPGADPSSAVLGYGILWDSEGDDRYQGTDLSQSAALFGAALHLDDVGQDVYSATGFSQGFALAGVALLLSGGGNDRFSALTHAQGSAGPEGVAVLIDTGGNDHYLLGNDPLVMPSSQLAERNVSMGQGAGRGERASAGGNPSTTGGIGVLFDLAGDDHYTAQVFAQGAGYYEGVGLLIDGGGRDMFAAAWYAMAASAHQAVGVLVNRGGEDDTYQASHSTSLGAAHDFSVAFFVDEAGDDTYALGNLGLGAAHDNSVAVFLELAGNDRYSAAGVPCLAFGAVKLSDQDDGRRDLPGVGLFVDRAGDDRYPPNCSEAANGAAWPPPKGGLHKPSIQAGIGLDVEFSE